MTNEEKTAFETLTQSFTKMETLYKIKCNELEVKQNKIKRLEAENAEQRARLDKAVEFKYDIGDTVYLIQMTEDEKDVMIVTINVVEQVVHKDTDINITYIAKCADNNVCYFFEDNDIGKWVFTDKSKAEARLAELKGDKNDK